MEKEAPPMHLPDMPPQLITTNFDLVAPASASTLVPAHADPVLHSLFPPKRRDVKAMLEQGTAFRSEKL